jgi:hypothetical protein
MGTATFACLWSGAVSLINNAVTLSKRFIFAGIYKHHSTPWHYIGFGLSSPNLAIIAEDGYP